MSNSKKKVLYVITKSTWGGAQRYVFDLATRLPADSFEVVVACGGDGPLVDRLRAAGVHTTLVKSFVRDVSPLRDIRTLRELIALFRTEAPDVVHLNSAKAVSIGALAARIAGVPRIVATIHGSASGETWRPQWQRVMIRTIEYISRLLAHETIVVSAHDHVSGTTLIHNGVANIDGTSKEEARAALGFPLDTVTLGTIGELTQNKNQQVLIDAFGSQSASGVTLTLVGDGEMRAELEQHAQKYPSHDIRFLGYQDNAAQYLRAFDIFALPSRKEGLPYVLLEAGLAGLPVVATNVGGIPEIIEDKKTGLLVAPGDFPALATALQVLLEDQTARAHYGKALQEKVVRDFSLENMITKTTALY